MEKRVFTTALGEVWLWGELAEPEGIGPVVVGISGAFADESALDRLGAALPGTPAFVSHLPGNHSPPLSTTSIGAYAAAYGSVVAQLGRPTILCGASLGGLVALGVKAPNLRAIVALDPPFRTAKLWRLIDRMRTLDPSTLSPHERDLIANVFGVSPSGVEDRNYLGLLEGLRTPTLCVLGGIPLMPRRALADDPSFVDEDEREALRAHPMIEVRVVPDVGHNITGKAGPQVVAALRAAVASVQAA